MAALHYSLGLKYLFHPSSFLKTTAEHGKGAWKGGDLVAALKTSLCLPFGVSVLSPGYRMFLQLPTPMSRSISSSAGSLWDLISSPFSWPASVRQQVVSLGYDEGWAECSGREGGKCLWVVKSCYYVYKAHHALLEDAGDLSDAQESSCQELKERFPLHTRCLLVQIFSWYFALFLWLIFIDFFPEGIDNKNTKI